jgi:hypothetical protein
MKLSTVLFVIFCAGTLLVQVLVSLGFKKGYEEHLLFVKKQVFPINDFPLENIKVVVANGVRFTMYLTKSQQGFKQDVRPEGITFKAQGDTLFISSKEGQYNERNYFETYFHRVPTLILTNANANISVNTDEELNTRIEKNGKLLVQKSRFRKINAEVKDSSALVFNEDATVDLLEVNLKDSAALRDNNANISRIIPTYISDKASLSLSGKGLRALHTLSPQR